MSPLVEATVYAPATGAIRRWTCPMCWLVIDTAEPPAGWLVFRPFDRVAACVSCRDEVIIQLNIEGIVP